MMELATEVETELRLEIQRLSEEVSMLAEKMDSFVTLAHEIRDNVEPAFTALKSSPIGKMLGV
jgi:hypothetical protein